MTAERSRLTLESRVPDGPQTFEFRTTDGVHSPDEFREGELALLEALWGRKLGTVLCLQANYGVVGTVLARSPTDVLMTETSVRASRLCRENAERNDADAAVSLVESPAGMDASFDTCCYAPHEYTPIDVGKQRLVDGLSTLDPGGRCYLAGRESGGVNRYERCLNRHCPTVETIFERGEFHVVVGTAPESFDRSRYVEYRTVRTTVGGIELTLATAPGLFSPTALDDGTRHLLETATVRDGQRVLDLCCGYGPVGAYAARAADVEVVLADDDVRATACANRTLDRTGATGTVVPSDGIRQIDGTFDHVLCNPPTHAGSGVLSELFGGVRDVLERDGTLSVVHHRKLDLDHQLRRVGEIVERFEGENHTVVSVSP
ncbi:methyltransferase [Natrarchaeobius sp. A-rgal3]|uniref:methyltransferase n=1 Tax=Natrarchaeobius versutus TaxID=1679078 RepID=UPI00350F99AA